MYNGKANKRYLETRVRIYKGMKTKTSMSITPDQDSVLQAIKRVHYQAFHWYRCTDITIPEVSFEDHGWKWDEKEGLVVPVWFEGLQLPPSFTARRRRQRATCYQDDSTDADDMSDDDEEKGENRVRRESGAMSGDERQEEELDYNADNENEEEHTKFKINSIFYKETQIFATMTVIGRFQILRHQTSLSMNGYHRRAKYSDIHEVNYSLSLTAAVSFGKALESDF